MTKFRLDSVDLNELANHHGTPSYLYSSELLHATFEQWKPILQAPNTQVCYAVKANGNLTLLKKISSSGFGADIVSGGELFKAKKAGFSPDQIVFSGVGKKSDELVNAITSSIHMINVESVSELKHIAAVAKSLRCKARIGIRINPDIAVATHPHIATGLYSNKFGIAETDLTSTLEEIRNHSGNIELKGLACHIGSQITESAPLQLAAERMALLFKEWKSRFPALDSIDLGGGLGIAYQDNEKILAVSEYYKALSKPVVSVGAKLILEPGRSLIAKSGMILCRVISIKRNPSTTFAIIDASMTELIRPALYDAYHKIELVRELPAKSDFEKYNIVGPVCESADFIAKERSLPTLFEGDLLLIRDTGAYGASMGSTYNARPLAPELFLEAGKTTIIRRRQSIQELISLEC